MDLQKYFEETKGVGVLATANAAGKVDAAVYARPHIMENDTLAFIMAEHLTHENLKTNPWAAYLFMESNKEYTGKRLYLKKTKEEQNDKLISEICRRCNYPASNANRFVVYFSIENVLPLVGSDSKR
jgi:hypothetical protein